MTTKSKEYENLVKELQQTHTTLVAVSKTRSPEEILTLYTKGQLDFGENKVQELQEKRALLPQDIRWHFIGHLQTNKVKYLSDYVHLIHSVDSIKLLDEIEKRAREAQRTIFVLFQVHIAKEQSKYGILPANLMEFTEVFLQKNYRHVVCKGLMGMATFTNDVTLLREEFKSLHALYLSIQEKEEFKKEFNTLSMGMSQDYKTAIAHGSTMVRIGSALFGERA
jgi:PLP dependent protein